MMMWLLTFLLAVQYVGPVNGLRANVALYRESRQSSIHYEKGLPSVSSLANDGNRHQVYEIPHVQLFCSHTMCNEVNYWWAVDIGRVYNVNSVTIYNRQDCCSDRLSDVYIYVYDPTIATWSSFDQEDGQLCFYYQGIVPGVYSEACNRNLQGRYVKIYKDYKFNSDGDCLSLCEVEVYTDDNANEGLYCRQLTRKPNLSLIMNLKHTSHIRCAIICRQTEGCLGFGLATENTCSLFKASQQVDIVNIDVEYYERC
ncbi:unnamed protein product [Mytilus coruscus]|uniref:Fucolectin tachylectin-4 pentraxin-1 domain-containing protein n=1 Tax=Mytilus coruscus TaxID=42192 RepID=A0A6J8E6N8_MYTCO|nr:unnamed protein product [Mytilus coruscus]